MSAGRRRARAVAVWSAAALMLSTGSPGVSLGEGRPAPGLAVGSRHRAGYLPSRDRVLHVLALGSDARPGEPVNRLRADSIHVISINPAKRSATILGFPRDSWVDIPGFGTQKINETMPLGGPELAVRTVEQLTGIGIDYWMVTSFQGFSNLVDGIGGLDVVVEQPMHDFYSGSDFDPGLRHLEGGHALAFARDRHSFFDGDFARSRNQGVLIEAALEKLKKIVARVPPRLLTWVSVATRNVSTDLDAEEIFDLALTASTVDLGKVDNVVAPGSVGYAGAASVVFLSPAADSLFADVRDDGVLD